MNNKPLLSICIPTYNRAEYLDKSLYSIISQKDFSSNDVELVISDNASTDNTEEIVRKYQKLYSNILYFKNSINIFENNHPQTLCYANGLFRKLSNDTLIYSSFSVKHMLNIIKENFQKKPILFFLNCQNIKITKNNYFTNDFNTFIKIASFYTTWIGSFGIWAEDFEKIEDKFEACSLLLWHTKILFEMLEKKKSCFIDNTVLFTIQNIEKKDLSYGLYNVFYKNYLGLYQKYLSTNTLSNTLYAYLKKHLLFNFFLPWLIKISIDPEKYCISKNDETKKLIFNAYRFKYYIISFYLKYYSKLFKIFIKNQIKYYCFSKNKLTKTKYLIKLLIPKPLKFLIKKKFKFFRMTDAENEIIWRSSNKHNFTTKGNNFDHDSVIVGKNTYGKINLINFSNDDNKLIIGNYCSIANNVEFVLGGEHEINTISTYPFKVKIFGYENEAKSKGDIIIDDDVWIGINCIIFSGIHIGQGAIIGAGSVVTKSVDPYSIVAGNPAQFIKYRLNQDLRKKLLSINICELFDTFCKDDINLIYSPITEELLENFLNRIHSIEDIQ